MKLESLPWRRNVVRHFKYSCLSAILSVAATAAVVTVLQQPAAAQLQPLDATQLPPTVYISGPPGRTSIANTNQAFYEHPDGCDLRVRWSDGTVEVLVATDSIPGGLSVTDPCVSLDGSSVLYAHIATDGRGAKIADIWRIKVSTRAVEKLTDASTEWSPPRGSMNFAPHPTPLNNTERSQWQDAGLAWMHNNRGVWNTGPCELPGGRIVFTSNRSGVEPTKQDIPALQLFVMDGDGKNVEKLGHLNLGGALHPTVLKNGRIAWSSGEQQGYRGDSMWGIWEIAPDGGQFGPLVSSYKTFAAPFHFQTETSNGSLVAGQYYQNRTYGALLVAPAFTPTFTSPPTMFGFPIAKQNPLVKMGHSKSGTAPIVNWQYPFQRRGLFNLIPDQTAQDWNPYVFPDGTNAGASTHPAAAPGNGLLFAMRKGPRDTGEIGIYYVPDVSNEYAPQQLVQVVDEPGVMECFPRALVPYSAIHGVAEPARFTSPMDDTLLPGEPYGVVGTASMTWRETESPTKVGGKNAQGGDYGVDTADIEYIGILRTMPNEAVVDHANLPAAIPAYSHNENNRLGFGNEFNERTALYSELIPLKKWRQPDGSVLYGANKPGTLITGPDGQPDTSFAAKVPANQPWTFVYLDAQQNFLGMAQTWHQLIPGEKYTSCGGCHAHNQPAPFAFEETFAASFEYTRPQLDRVSKVVEWLADIKPIFDRYGITHTRQTLHDQGLAGFDFISATAPFMQTLPAEMTAEERRLIGWWIGTGMTEGPGANKDGLPPGLALLPPRKPTESVTQIIVGVNDPDSGVDDTSLSIKTSFDVDILLGGCHMVTRAAGTELASDFQQDGERWILDLANPVTEGAITVSVKDIAGNETRQVRSFEVP